MSRTPGRFGPNLYDRWRHSEVGVITDRLEQNLILQLVGPVSGRRVLDIGCGDGELALALQQRGATVVGLDASPPMLEAARARASMQQADLALCLGRAERLPFADESFDVVVAVTILCFVPAAEATFAEIGRVLRPGGRLVIGELGRWSTWSAARRCRGWLGSALWRSARFRTSQELRRLARAGGLTPVEVRGAIYYPRWKWAARHLARFETWLGSRTTIGAAFLALAAVKPEGGSPRAQHPSSHLPDHRIAPDRIPSVHPRRLDPAERARLEDRIARRLTELNAVLIAHYYTAGEIQDLARATGGHVGDSLDMARFGKDHAASTLVIAGVRFMAETAKILSPDKRVILPAHEADCSLDMGCPAEEFAAFCRRHPDRTVVVYANTSAAVKALADWVVTSSVAVRVVAHLHQRGEKILWAPDRYLGDYVRRRTGADMLMWTGACVVHEEFDPAAIARIKASQPGLAVLVHPECRPEVIDLADAVGSTSQMLVAAEQLPNRGFLVATSEGLLHELGRRQPEKTFTLAPVVAGTRCAGTCPWMAMNEMGLLAECLDDPNTMAAHEVQLDADIRARALVPLQRLMDFA